MKGTEDVNFKTMWLGSNDTALRHELCQQPILGDSSIDRPSDDIYNSGE